MRQERKILIAVFGLALILGLAARLQGLGDSPLAEDEYYIAKSVDNINHYGVPKFQCGGYYDRALIFQYLGVFLIRVIERSEWVLRIISVIANLAALPAIVLLGRRLAGEKTAWIAAVLFCLSLWEIEFSRFARMYTMFQTVFLYYIYMLFRLMLDDDWRYFPWMLGLSLLSLLIHEAGAFLLVANMLPLVKGERRAISWEAVTAFLILAAGYALLSIDTRHVGAGVAAAGNVPGPPKIPMFIFLIRPLAQQPAWLAGYLLLLIPCVYAAYRIIRSLDAPFPTRFGRLLLIALAALNQFGFLVLAALVLALMGWIKVGWPRDRQQRIEVASMTLMFSFWILYLLSNQHAIRFYGYEGESIARSIFAFLFKSPNILHQVMIPWAHAVPMLSFAITMAILSGVLFQSKSDHTGNRRYRLLVALCIIFLALVGIIPVPYQMTRYSFHIYPVLLLLSVEGFRILSVRLKGAKVQKIIFLFLIGIFVMTTEDFSAVHALNIRDAKYMYRTAYDYHRGEHYYFRMDYRGVADTVNQRMIDGDLIITDAAPADYYLKRLDFFYMDSGDWEYRNIAVCEETRDRWSNARLVNNLDQLQKILRAHSGAVWIIGTENERNQTFRSNMSRWLASHYADQIVGRSVDGKLVVYRIGGHEPIR
jgi:hypothetical protein